MRRAFLLGCAVYVRLLCDRHAPMVGKLAVAFAIAYGVASRDLMPDAWFPAGLLDDLLVVVLASRGFMLICPEHLVQEHAARTTRARERLRTWRRSRT